MKNKMSILIAGLLAALLAVSVIGAIGASAQGSATTLLHGGPPGDGRGHGLGQAELEAAAKVLGMTVDEVSAALKDGKTLQDLADQAGVAIEDVQAAIQAAHVAEIRANVQQALDDGTITQENADWLFEGLDKGFIGVPGAFGFGGPHGHGFDKNSSAQPAQQNNP